MPIRSKVKLAYIWNNAARRSTFNKRKAGLLKKAAELSNLCGVETCAVVYGPYSNAPAIFPPSLRAVSRIVKRFAEFPRAEKSKKMVNQSGFLRQRVRRAATQLKLIRRQNKVMEAERLMLDGISSPEPARVLAGLSHSQLNNLGHVIDRSLMEIDDVMNRIKI